MKHFNIRSRGSRDNLPGWTGSEKLSCGHTVPAGKAFLSISTTTTYALAFLFSLFPFLPFYSYRQISDSPRYKKKKKKGIFVCFVTVPRRPVIELYESRRNSRRTAIVRYPCHTDNSIFDATQGRVLVAQLSFLLGFVIREFE